MPDMQKSKHMKVGEETREKKKKSTVNSKKNKRPYKRGKVTTVPRCGRAAKSIYGGGLGNTGYEFN